MRNLFQIMALVFLLALVSCTSSSTGDTLDKQLVDTLKSEKGYINSVNILSITEYKGTDIVLFFYKIGALDYLEVRLFESEGEKLKLTSGTGGHAISPGAEMFTLGAAAPFLADGENFGIVYGQLLSDKIAAIEVVFRNDDHVYHEINNEKGFIVAHEEGEFWGIKEIKAFDTEQNLIYSFPPE